MSGKLNTWPNDNVIKKPVIYSTSSDALAGISSEKESCSYYTNNMVNGSHNYREVSNEKCVIYVIERMSDIVYDFNINVPKHLPQPIAYSIEIGGKPIYKCTSPNCPIPLISIQFNEIKLIAQSI